MWRSHGSRRRRASRSATAAVLVGVLVAVLVPATPRGASAQPGAAGELLGVACRTSASCLAVGSHRDAVNASQPFGGHSTGTSWSFGSPPKPSAPKYSRGLLASVACPTATKCFAVGNYYDSVTNRALIEQWDGAKWTIVSRIRPVGARWSVLSDISCPSSTVCIAVGSSVTEELTKAFAVRWNGQTWSTLTTPREDAEAHDSRLNSVSCLSVADCVAVGTFRKVRTWITLIERWNGTRWKLMPSPNGTRPLGYFELYSVSCATADSCSAVGIAMNVTTADHAEPFAERWNGLRWLIVPTPTAPTRNYFALKGISCPASDACFAVGYRQNFSTNTTGSLVERWDGKTWTIVPTGLVSINRLNAISCRTRTSCIAVGGTKRAAVARLGGATWSAEVE